MPGRRLSQIQFVTTLTEKSGLSKKQAVSALDAINAIIVQQLGKQGPGEVLIPGLLLLSMVDKPATQEHDGVNPNTKQPMIYKARPARRVIRARPLRALMDTI